MREALTKPVIRTFLAPIRWINITSLVFFLASGAINNVRAWMYVAVYVVGGLIVGVILIKRTPKLLHDRVKMQEGTKQFDKYIILTYFLFAIIITPLIAGIDQRCNLSATMPFYYLYVGIILYIISAIFSTWPMLHNPFFEGAVRIQKDKNHTLINTGPYRIVRHPGYLGMFLGSVSLPLALGSVLALIPLFVLIVLIIVRTYYEDTTLQKELAVYSEYCKDVRYRLIPFIW
ncbi:MAG: isoprenylcysteine carboxylmethyltransferase family protein [Bacteroidales bacterium]|nr:isoprenylcysteine carboxylmethyltransferase family protein [Bacteroidales bacterium]